MTDRLPEYTDYQDDGCDLAPKCLTCPFEYCQFDVRRGTPSKVPMKLLDLTKPRSELATEYGVSKRQIYRTLARARQAQEAEAC